VTESTQPGPAESGPAFYAQPRFLHGTRLREWWTLLHPPYTALHLSLVMVGACLNGPVNSVRLAATLIAFFLAVGVGAHSLDELHGRPLMTTIPTRQLVIASCVGLGGAVALGVVGMVLVSPYLALFMGVGVLIAVGYNLELLHGQLHTTVVFILGWGAFPILTAYFAQHARLSVASLVAALYGALVTQLQRQLSTPARDLRRRTITADGVIVRSDGTTTSFDKQALLQPLEAALRTLCWSGVALALALAFVRFTR
jgi:hypothetical protein